MSPFDAARFAALTEGLEVSLVRASDLDFGNPDMRLDAEFFQRSPLQALADIARHPSDTLSQLSQRIQHPAEVLREYSDDGLETLMAGSIRPNRADVTDLPMMDPRAATQVANNVLKRGDLVLVRTGANFGTATAWKYDRETYACADLLVARAPSAPSGYLSSFLSGRFGKPLIARCGYGSAQPHISPAYVGLIPVPRLGVLEAEIDGIVDAAVTLEAAASAAIQNAEMLLLSGLGLDSWVSPEPLTFTRSSKDVLAGRRLDANFYAPRYAAIVERIRESGSSVSLGEGLQSFITRGRQPDYTDDGLLVINSKHVRANRVLTDETNRRAAPSPIRVQRGDLLINGTGVGTIGRAGVYSGDSEALPDNHVTIVRQSRIDPLFLSVFLNSKAGQLQIEQQISGSSGQIEIYPDDLRNILVWEAPSDFQQRVSRLVRDSFALREKSNACLNVAKAAVEYGISQGASSALDYVASQVEITDAASA